MEIIIANFQQIQHKKLLLICQQRQSFVKSNEVYFPFSEGLVATLETVETVKTLETLETLSPAPLFGKWKIEINSPKH